MNILDTIKSDLKADVAWVEKEAGVALSEAEKLADQALQDIWGVAKSVFTQFEPQAVSTVLSGVIAFLTKAGTAGSLADLETAFLNEAETLGGELLSLARGFGSNFLQVLLGLAIQKLKGA